MMLRLTKNLLLSSLGGAIFVLSSLSFASGGGLALPELIYSESVSDFSKKSFNDFQKASEAGSDIIVHITLGTEAADSDSVVGAFGEAFYQSLNFKSLPQEEGEVEHIFCPFINLSEDELRLRKDVELVLSNAGVNPGNLLFMENKTESGVESNTSILKGLISEGRLVVHLVDHNELAWYQSFLAPAVTSILDHHEDGNVDYPKLVEKIIVHASKLKSATSFIANRLLSFEDDAFNFHASWKPFLLAPVLLDSKNLKKKELAEGEEIMKTVDDAVAETLVSDIQASNPEFSQDDYYQNLRAALKDKTDFTAIDLLKKDKKSYFYAGTKYVVSSVYKWEDGEEGYDTALEEYRKLLGVDLAIFMESPHTGERRFVVHCPDVDIHGRLVDFFEARGDRTDEEASFSDSTTLFLHGSKSRKKVAPLLKLFFESESHAAQAVAE